MAEHSFTVRNGRVEVHSGDQLEWAGQVLGVVALDAFSLPGTTDGIVVLDWMDLPEGVESWHSFHNLVRIRSDGNTVWQAELPDAEPSFVQAKWDEGVLFASAWSHCCKVDPETGQILETTFTK